jgi:hypothetical protein
MINIEDLVGEFDEQYRIVHLTARRPIHVTTLAQGRMLSKAVNAILTEFLADRRGYMITDYSKIIIEPEKIDEYAAEMRQIIDRYLYPEGLARYGFEITRVTARLGHAAYLGGSPNLFNTKREAETYIHTLAERHMREGIFEVDDSVTIENNPPNGSIPVK